MSPVSAMNRLQKASLCRPLRPEQRAVRIMTDLNTDLNGLSNIGALGAGFSNMA
jgi:hypothetical protein